MISAPLSIRFYTWSLSTHCASQLTRIFSFNSFGDPIKSTTLSPFTTKQMQPEWWRDLPMLSQVGCGRMRFEITSAFL